MATVAVFVALGGGALAATNFIGSDGQIHGCVKKGHLTLVRAGAKCGKGKSAISWNQTGPQGIQGLQGAQGITGDAGTAGTNGATHVVVRSLYISGAAGTASCKPGEVATGGGATPDSADSHIFFDEPVFGANGVPSGWKGELVDKDGVNATSGTVYVVCASP
jgi:hypothetical protein